STTRSSRSVSACCDSTAPSRRRSSCTSATTPASTRCRRRSCASSCGTSPPGTRRGVRPRRATPSSSTASWRRRSTRRATSTTCTACAHPSGTSWLQRSPRPRSGRRSTTSRRSISSPRSATSATRRATSRRPRRPPGRTSACRSGRASRRSSRRRSPRSSSAPPSSFDRDARGVLVRFPVNRHRAWQVLFDAVLIVVAWRLTFFLRFDKTTPVFYRHLLDWQVVALVVAIKLVVFVTSGFYNRWWRYVSTHDMWSAMRGVTAASAVTYLVLYAFPPNHTSRLPRGIAAFDFLLLLALVTGTRLLARSLIERPPSGLV